MMNPRRLIPPWAFSGVRFKYGGRHAVLKAKGLRRKEERTLKARIDAAKDAKRRAFLRIPKRKDLLSERLLTLGGGSIIDVALSRYVIDRKVMKLREIELCVTEFYDQKRYGYALGIFKWMENSGFPLTYANRALRMDLTSKVQGIDYAVEYFDKIPTPEKTQLTYAALLKCYSEHELADKAFDLFQEMDTMGLLSSSAFETIISLHTKLHQAEKIPPLIQKMQDSHFSKSNATYGCWMRCCERLGDMNGLRKILREMELDRVSDWSLFSELAEIYVKAGKFKKAEIALKDMEDLDPTDRKAYRSLIRLYAATSNPGAVGRIWAYLTEHFKRTHSCFLAMILALAKLGDVSEFNACFKEWKLHFKKYDMNVANAAIGAYLRWGMFDAARGVLHVARRRSPGPFIRAQVLFSKFFVERRTVNLALEYLDAAVCECDANDWRSVHHHRGFVKAFFECLEEKKDVDGGERLCWILKKVDCLDCGAYEGLIRVYVGAGKKAAGMRKRVEDDGIEISPDLEKLLESCVS